MNKERTVSRVGASLEDVKTIIEKIYLKKSFGDYLVKKRFLALQLVLFFGLKRFSDVNMIKVKDVNFKKDGSVEIWMRKTKTDAVARGKSFVLTEEELQCGCSIGSMLQWYK